MNDLTLIAQTLVALFQASGVPEELLTGQALRSPLHDGYGVQLRFQPQQQRWMLGVDRNIALWDEAAQARCEEKLLRMAYASRFAAQQLGMLDAGDHLGLVDCDFPGTPQQAAEHATEQAIEGRLQELLNYLMGLEAPTGSARSGDAEGRSPNGLGAASSFATTGWTKA